MKKRISRSLTGALILSGILCGWTIAQYGDSQPSAWPSAVIPDRRERFIAAVDWSVDRTPEFVWPFESMPAAPYDSVRVVVESMPRLIDARTKEKREALIPSRHLKINGRLQKPVRVVRSSRNREVEQEEFLIKLDRGRLRLTLLMPPGTTFEEGRTVVRIKLYEA